MRWTNCVFTEISRKSHGKFAECHGISSRKPFQKQTLWEHLPGSKQQPVLRYPVVFYQRDQPVDLKVASAKIRSLLIEVPLVNAVLSAEPVNPSVQLAGFPQLVQSGEEPLHDLYCLAMIIASPAHDPLILPKATEKPHIGSFSLRWNSCPWVRIRTRRRLVWRQIWCFPCLCACRLLGTRWNLGSAGRSRC